MFFGIETTDPQDPKEEKKVFTCDGLAYKRARL